MHLPAPTDGQAMRRRLEINQAEALDTVTMVDAGHGEDVGLIVEAVELVVGHDAEEAHEHSGVARGLPQARLIVLLAVAAHQPVLDAFPLGGRQGLQGLDDEELTLARMQPPHGEDHGPVAPRRVDPKRVEHR